MAIYSSSVAREQTQPTHFRVKKDMLNTVLYILSKNSHSHMTD
jgi:hypothetical protein